jgi:peptidase C25-like protein
MRTRSPWLRRTVGLYLLTAAALLWGGSSAFGASTGSSNLYMPQGSAAGTDLGDFVTSNAPVGGTTGLNTFYRYFIEVPPSLSRLRVQIFDADLGAGGTGEAASQRDRGRGTGGAFSNTNVRYTLLDPTGKARPTLFAIGNATTPPNSDGAWLSLFDGTGGGNGNFVADNFLTIGYTNNDGNNNWTGSWTEANDGNGSPPETTGGIQVIGGVNANGSALRIGNVGNGQNKTPSVFREVNLSATGLNLSTATLTFNFRSVNAAAGDSVVVEVSANGVTGPFTVLETFTNASAAGARSYNITTSIATNTRVRFRVTGGLGTSTDFFFFDTIQIADAGGPLTAGHWELRVDESSAVTAADDINAIGIRADVATSGGTEIPIYIDSINQFGVNPPTSGTNTRSYSIYPYITSGCTARESDFDYDSDQTSDVGQLTFSSRTGATTQAITHTSLSSNNVWHQNTINSWTTDSDSTEDGIWSLALRIDSYAGPSGNYTDVMIGNSSLANANPTANPVTNAFRIYLPTDAGSAPVKPYVEQFVRLFSGTNPPQVGQTQRDTITVRVVNPTAQAITFSSTNLVTVNVPGGTVLYAGNPQITQGTITAPSVGGSGNITWNPGTVAAGATVILAYDVDITPTMSGQRIIAVGTVASGNGTRATWVDETGNTTQGRATYTFGPLCEVAVTQGMLTQAVVSSLTAFPADGGLALEWRTASEAGTIGFDLYRRAADGAWKKVNRSLLHGLLTAPQGGTYRVVDPEASPRVEQIYKLVEIDAAGHRRSHGPFTVRADWRRAGEGKAGYARIAHSPQPATKKPTPKAAPAGGPIDALRVLVRESGLYYLSSSDLAARFGVPLSSLENTIREGKLALSHGGAPVAWYPDVDLKRAKGLFFYGEAIGSLYTRDNVYRLERGTGLLMQAATAAAPSGTAPASFAATLHAEQDLLPATVLPLDPASDYWFWDFLLGGDPDYGSKSFALDTPGAVSGAGGTATLTVHFQGASDSGVAGEHHPAVSLNGTLLGETRFQGIAAMDATFSFAPALLTPAGNQVQVTGLLDPETPYSVFFVDSFDLTYPRSFQAAGGALAFTGAAGSVSVGGFGDPAVRLVDLSTPARPRWLTGAPVSADPQGGWKIAFQSPGQAPYLAAAGAGLKAPTAVTPFRAPHLRASSNHADLVVLAGAGLHDAAQRLADYRAAQGLDSMVVDFDEVTDEFAFGLPDPHAIPSFLAYARSAWRTAPRYLVLAGAGTVDYRDILGYGGDLLPPLFLANADGIFASDILLVDLVGNDGLPELAVGRIPARSAAELNAYVDKIVAYENGADSSWVGSAMALADAVDQGADFAAQSERVVSLLPAGYNVDRIYLDATALPDARSRLFHDLGAGASLVDYIGHGGLDRLSSEGLLTSDDVASLGNGSHLPVLTAMTCAVNRFAVPGFPSLGELLVDQANGGAAAVWSPSGLSIHSEAQLLAERFYRHLADTDGARLGDLVLRALKDFQTLGGSKSMIQIYNLLGDPALRLRRASPASTGTGQPSRE